MPPTILIHHLGIDINKRLNAGDRQRPQVSSIPITDHPAVTPAIGRT